MSGLSPAPVSLPDEHSDYECFVADIQKDFELRVEAVQRAADENTRVYEVYSSELKKQLQESLVANQRLEECCARLEEEVARSVAERRLVESKVTEIQQREQDRVDGVVELLSSMACVRVTQVEISGDTAVYTCAIIYGSMKDHKFSLSLDKSTWEYTYKPLSFVVVTSKGTLDIDLNTASSFPDYMISRFLENLLRITLS